MYQVGCDKISRIRIYLSLDLHNFPLLATFKHLPSNSFWIIEYITMNDSHPLLLQILEFIPVVKLYFCVH